VPRFVVLLRGINVGRAKRLAMADLRALLADAGYTDVRTVLNSGNAVVTGPDEPPAAHAARVETAITERTGLDVRVVVLTAGQLHEVAAANPFTDVALTGGEVMPAALLVAADGARSRLREQAGIGWISWPYRQSGIVATIVHERDHEGRAVEHFLPSGPFAILPLKSEAQSDGSVKHRSSIVWTERSENVPALLESGADDLLAELERRFGLGLGRIAFETRPQAHPLAFGVARSFVAERLALLGDAAHLIHPIAGQGLNLGLHDAAALAEIVADAMRLGMDPGGPDVLAQYERARRADITAMGAMTDGLNRLFSNDFLPLRLIRDLGLGLVDRMPGLKRFFIREAAGLRDGSAPRLLRGEAL